MQREFLLESLKSWCKQHNVVLRWSFERHIEIAEKLNIDPLTGQFPSGKVYDSNLMYIDGSGHIHQNKS